VMRRRVGFGGGCTLAADVEGALSGGDASAGVAKLEMSEGGVEMPRCMRGGGGEGAGGGMRGEGQRCVLAVTWIERVQRCALLVAVYSLQKLPVLEKCLSLVFQR
jgi:hypothetical protein